MKRILGRLNFSTGSGGDDKSQKPAKISKPLEWTVITGESFEWRVARNGFVAPQPRAPRTFPMIPPVPIMTLSMGHSIKWPSTWMVRITRTPGQGFWGNKVFLGIFISPKDLPPVMENSPRDVWGLFFITIEHPTVPSKNIVLDGSNQPWEVAKTKSWGWHKVLDLNRLDEFVHPDGNLVIWGEFQLQKEKEPVDDMWAAIDKFRRESHFNWKNEILRELGKPESKDVQIQTSDGHTYPGNKMILAVRSRKLAEELKKLPKGEDILKVPEPWEVFHYALCYIYNGYFNEVLWDSQQVSHDLWLQIVNAAERYNLTDFKEFLMLRPMSPPQHSNMEPEVVEFVEFEMTKRPVPTGQDQLIDGSGADIP